MIWDRLNIKAMERDIPAPSTKQFAFTFAVVFLLLFFWQRAQVYSYAFLILSALFLLVGFTCSQILRVPTQWWHRLGLFLSWLISPLILSFMYFITIVPTAFFLKLKKHESLSKKGKWIKKNKDCRFDRSF